MALLNENSTPTGYTYYYMKCGVTKPGKHPAFTRLIPQKLPDVILKISDQPTAGDIPRF